MVTVLGAGGAAAQDCRLSAAQVEEMTTAARAANPKNDKSFLKALDDAVKGKDRKLETSFVFLERYVEGLTFALMSPYARYRLQLETALRKMEPIEKATFEPEFTILVSASRIDAPDIEKVVVQRDGVTVEPIGGGLTVEEMTTRMGAKAAFHTGEIRYACSAFAPNGTVTITAIPVIGKNIVKTLKSDELAALK
jgi:hypothetical protein